MTYYALICPICLEKIGVGNWKDMLILQYKNHVWEFHKPIIIKSRNVGTKEKKNVRK